MRRSKKGRKEEKVFMYKGNSLNIGKKDNEPVLFRENFINFSIARAWGNW